MSMSSFSELTSSPPCRKVKSIISPQTKPEALQAWGWQGRERLWLNLAGLQQEWHGNVAFGPRELSRGVGETAYPEPNLSVASD